VAGLASGVLVAGLVMAGALEPTELALYDRLFELRGPHGPRAPIVIISIDEASIIELNRWPFPRATHARLIERVSAGGPLAIGFDLVFDAPSLRGPDDDAALGDAVARAGNVVLAAARTQTRGVVPRIDVSVPIQAVRAGAASVGLAALPDDVDGHVRRSLLVPPKHGMALPALGVALDRLARDARLPAAPVPLTPDLLINFRGGPRSYRWFSYYRVLNGDVRPETFRGKIVLVGATTDIAHDVYQTPFARAGGMPGVEVHANIIETLIHGNRIREVPALVGAVGAVALALLVGILVAVRPGAMVPIAVLGLVAIVGGTVASFAFLDIWMRQAGPVAALELSVVACIVAEQTRGRAL